MIYFAKVLLNTIDFNGPSFDEVIEMYQLTPSSSCKTANVIGLIIAVAAVLFIHIEINIVVAINPKLSLNF